MATAALVKASREAEPHSSFAAPNLVLYFDEPNMGIHLDPQVCCPP